MRCRCGATGQAAAETAGRGTSASVARAARRRTPSDWSDLDDFGGGGQAAEVMQGKVLRPEAALGTPFGVLLNDSSIRRAR